MEVIEGGKLEVEAMEVNEYGVFALAENKIWVMAIWTDGKDKRLKDVISELVRKWKTNEVHFTNVLNPKLLKLRNATPYLVKTKSGEKVINIKVIWE